MREKPEIQKDVHAFKYQKKFEKLRSGSREQSSNANVPKSAKDNTARNSIICYCCAEKGHIAKDCAHRKKTCTQCNRRGHIVAACRSQGHRLQNITKQDDSSSSETESVDSSHIYNISSVGHTTSVNNIDDADAARKPMYLNADDIARIFFLSGTRSTSGTGSTTPGEKTNLVNSPSGDRTHALRHTLYQQARTIPTEPRRPICISLRVRVLNSNSKSYFILLTINSFYNDIHCGNNVYIPLVQFYNAKTKAALAKDEYSTFVKEICVSIIGIEKLMVSNRTTKQKVAQGIPVPEKQKLCPILLGAVGDFFVESIVS
ncbi:unnamed protein product, partial [Trichogramma brassicae]